MSKYWQSKSKGQSLVLIAVVMAALILIVGLALDGANAYTAQRKAQSAANAAAIAGTKRLAMSRDNPGSYMDVDIRAEIDAIVLQNGFDPSEAIAEYLDASGNVIGLVGSIGGPDTPAPSNAAYIRVRIGTQVTTYFVRLAGYDQVSVNAATRAHNVSRGAPGCTDGIYPIGVYDQGFSTGEVYWIWDGDPEAPEYPGNFGWLRWRQPPQFGSGPYLVRALTPEGTYGDPDEGYFDGETHILGPGRVMFGNTGLSGAAQVRDLLNYFVSSGEAMILPLWSQGSGQGSDVTYINSGFGAFRLMQVCFHHGQCSDVPDDVPPSAKALQVTFLGYSNAGCSVSVPIPPAEAGGQQSYATAQGLVYLCTPQVTILPPDQGSYLPVDVMHVVDSSGSMSRPLVGGGGKKKIDIEKEALVFFNSLMRPDLGDRLGAVKFQKYNQDVTVLSNLTHDMGYLNSRINALVADGLTPWGKAVLVGTATLFGPGRNPNNKPVLIIASDGAPTVDLDNQSETDYQNLDWEAMTPETLRYCYMHSTCAQYPGCQAVACPTGNGQPLPNDDPGIEVMIDALDAADVVKGAKPATETWWVRRHGGTCLDASCPFYGVQPHPEMEIFIIAIKGQDEFSSSVLKYVATAPATEHYFEVYQEDDAQEVYAYIANAISGQLPYCYIDSQPTLFTQPIQVQIIFGGAVIGSGGSSGDGSYTVPNIPVDPYAQYTITGTASYGGQDYGAANSCNNPGQIGVSMPLPQTYQVPIYLVPDSQPECPEGTIPIPPP